MLLFDRLHSALTRSRARTRPDHADPRLRGRTYQRSVAEVWDSARAVARVSAGWRETGSDRDSGEIRVEAQTRMLRFIDDVRIVVQADGQARARVDLESASRVGRADLGANARRIAQFLQRLDAHLARGAEARG